MSSKCSTPLIPAPRSLVNAQVREDFTAETTLEAIVETLRQQGRPETITLDRDPRFVGTQMRDYPSPLMRLLHCLGIKVTICPPRRPDRNGFVVRRKQATWSCLTGKAEEQTRCCITLMSHMLVYSKPHKYSRLPVPSPQLPEQRRHDVRHYLYHLMRKAFNSARCATRCLDYRSRPDNGTR